MKSRVYIVKGIARHFTGDVEISIVGVRAEEKAAQRLGSEWAKDQQEQFKAEGRNIHASYELVTRECPDLPGLTREQQFILNYIVLSVSRDLSLDEASGEYRDNGGIIISLTPEEYQTLKSIKL